MNRKLIVVFIVLFGAIGLSGLVAWAFYKSPKSNHRVVLEDASISSGADRCIDIVKLTENAARKPATTDKTKLAVFLTGDQQTANEPRELGSFDVPVQVKLTQGNSALKIQHSKILDEVKAKCQQLSPAKNSSIFLALKRAVEHLRSLGCEESSNCEVIAQTDLQENAEQQIKTAISGTSVNSNNLPAPIDNQGISIRICGISQTKGLTINQKGQKSPLTRNRNPARADLINEVWRKLFTHPDLVSFAPYCSE